MGKDLDAIEVHGYAAKDTTGQLVPFKFTCKYVIVHECLVVSQWNDSVS